MAKRKQISLEREPSDSSREPLRSPSHGWKQNNGNAQKNGQVVGNGVTKETSAPPSPKQAGFTQLVICVAGIYASL